MAAEAGAVQFSIGRVIGDSLGVFGRNFISFSILALLIGVLDLLMVIFNIAPAETQTLGQMNLAAVGLTVLVTLVVSGLTQASIIYGTFQDLRGSRAGIGDCIARGLSSVVPVILGTLILSLAVGLASILLIIPGIILALMWWVYIPAIVVEGKGIFDSFGRSRELTRGRRWHIFGLLFIVFLLAFVINFVITLVAAISIVRAPISDPVLVVSTIEYVAQSLLAAFSAVMVAVGYYYLRAEKEGVDVNAIASVFD